MRALILVITILLSGGAVAAGDVSRCHAIADADARNYCRAKAAGNRAICATIINSSLRAMCQAEIG